MASKVSHKQRLLELNKFVSDPGKLRDLQARSGNSLIEKLRQSTPGEKTWKDFLTRTTFGLAEQHALDQLNSLVGGQCVSEPCVGTDAGGETQSATTTSSILSPCKSVTSGAHAQLGSPSAKGVYPQASNWQAKHAMTL